MIFYWTEEKKKDEINILNYILEKKKKNYYDLF